MSSFAPIQSNNANQPTDVAVATSSTHIIADNTARKALYLINIGANPVRLALNKTAGTAVNNAGIYLAPSGSSESFEVILWKGAVDGIAVGGSSTVAVVELL